ncbi:hypothetical protein D9619_010322 [Psilocybe cf. subviscida]|uniref:Transcription factor IIIC 90kDa subunit N-terminal domain-containing protein n=1 Tax=Psilocybe cf. subviscida TaxID=2480587 RepID=A0A8H5AS03_9AGAR|nr:hypothetical protein D9619_010322 [Psilocybe cf. subviscida]
MSRPILTALPIPAVASHSSPHCLQWSADGQVAFLTETSVVILTPDHGINFDNESLVRATPARDDGALGWFKTGIQSDPNKSNRDPDIETLHWPDYSQTWGTVSLGSIDFSLIGLAISPSELSPTGHCIFATLSSNMDVMLWAARTNYLKGKWEQIFALTPFLLNRLAPGAPEEACSTAAVLQAQITTIAWTPQADFGFEPTPRLDGSLLVLGSRAGYLTFLRYAHGAAPEIISTLSVSDYWITHTAFTGWKPITPGKCEGLLAYATSRGAVGLVKITQTAAAVKGARTYGPTYTITAQFAPEKTPVYGAEARAGVTALQWAFMPGRTPILITCIPGLVNLWSARSLQDVKYWTGHRVLRIQPQKEKMYIGCSPFHPVSGLAVLLPHQQQDDDDDGDGALVVTLADGSFHVVAGLATDPAWKAEAPVHVEVLGDPEADVDLGADADGDPDADGDADMDMDMDMDTDADPDAGLDMLNSTDLSHISREVFTAAEAARPKTAKEEQRRGNLDRADMGAVAAARAYDGAGCFMWIYDASRPSDFSYKHDAKHSSMFVVAQMWDGVDDDGLLRTLEALLADAKAGSGLAPLHVLRPLLIHLRDRSRLARLHARLLQILRMQAPTDNAAKVVAPPTWDGGALSEGFRQQFRASLATSLFGWDDLLSLRMRLSLADFAWKLSSSEDRQAECGVVAQGLLGSISHRILRTLIRYLQSVVKLLTPKEVPFVSRIIVQSLLPGCPEDLREEGNQLSLAIQPFLTSTSTGGADASAGIVSQLNETCPACGVEVPLQDITTAVCANGHTWPRCSVTTFILATASPRTCVGCSRKAFLPPSAKKTLPPIAQGWVVEDLLEAVQRCLFCNNGFVSIL